MPIGIWGLGGNGTVAESGMAGLPWIFFLEADYLSVAASEKGGVNFAKTLDKVKRECYNMIREFF